MARAILKLRSNSDTFVNGEFYKAHTEFSVEDSKDINRLIKTGYFYKPNEVKDKTDGDQEYTVGQFQDGLENKEKSVKAKLKTK